MIEGLLLGLLLFGGHKRCHCKTCEKERKEDIKWWKNYYKSPSPSGSCSPSGSPNRSG